MPCDPATHDTTLSVTSTSNYVWFNVEKHSAGAIEIDGSSASGSWGVEVLRSCRASGDVGYAMPTAITFAASGITTPLDLVGIRRLGVKVTATGTGSLGVHCILKADR